MFAAPPEFRDDVMAASARSEVGTAVHEIYGRLQLEIDRRKPICVASGKCCHFEAYGHRLFVTTLEMAVFVRELGEPKIFASPGRKAGDRSAESDSGSPIPGLPAWAIKESKSALSVLQDPGGCRFQIDKLCSVHAIRPFGCRIFFCDPTAAGWQHQQYEAFHAHLRQLHGTFGVPYFYVEWREALRAVGLEVP